MSRSSRQKFTRVWHRRLGPIIGIQLLLWSLGGVYFSWVHLEIVRGERDMTELEEMNLKDVRYSPNLAGLFRQSQLNHVTDIMIGSMLDMPVVRMIQDDFNAELYHATTGEMLSPISDETAVQVATMDFAPNVPVSSVEMMDTHTPRGEYRGPLPAWKVSFGNWKKTALYVSVNEGRVVSRRSTIWRAFDFLWMLHIMDFQERNNFNNWLLRTMSVLGLVTVLSGYFLWYLTSPLTRPKKQRAPVND